MLNPEAINRKESLIPAEPLLFNGVNGFVGATESENKIKAFQEFLDIYPILRGIDYISVQPISNPEEEPSGEYAIPISQSKADAVFKKLSKPEKQQKAVASGDIVVYRGEEPLFNLSRERTLSGRRLKDEVEACQEYYSGDEEAYTTWDVAMSFIVPFFDGIGRERQDKQLRVTTGYRHTIVTRGMSPYVIKSDILEDMGKAKKRNTRFRLIEICQDCVIAANKIPLVKVSDELGYNLEPLLIDDELPYRGYWVEGSKLPEHMASVRREVLGNIPEDRRFENLLQCYPANLYEQGWILR
jgi:hypothetical protein